MRERDCVLRRRELRHELWHELRRLKCCVRNGPRYQSVYDTLSHFYDRVAEGGVVMLDDFGRWGSGWQKGGRVEKFEAGEGAGRRRSRAGWGGGGRGDGCRGKNGKGVGEGKGVGDGRTECTLPDSIGMI